MPRRPRHYLPEHAYHICQRGNNRQSCFREPRDRAMMVNRPSQYRWSSYSENALGKKGWMIQHPHFQQLSNDEKLRRRIYQKLVKSGVRPALLEKIRKSTARNSPLSEDDDLALELKMGTDTDSGTSDTAPV